MDCKLTRFKSGITCTCPHQLKKIPGGRMAAPRARINVSKLTGSFRLPV